MKEIFIVLFIIIFLPAVSAENITSINQTENESIHTTFCEAFSIEGLNQFVENGEKISYTFNGWQSGDNITYWIEDVFGEVWKNKYTSTNNNKKTYTTKIEERDRVLFLQAERERTGCELTYAEAMFIVINEAGGETEDNNSVVKNETQITENETVENEITVEEMEEYIKILNYDDELQSGNAMHVELSVQKNSNRNNVFYLWLENEEKKKIGETKINLHQKGTYELELELAVNLEKCGNAFEKQYLHFSGLGKEEKEKVYVLQEACKTSEKEEECSEIIISNDILLEENPLQSLYVRAQNWQENISLYSNLDEETSVWIFGPIADKKRLNEGTNTININPKVGNNTYALITAEGKGKIVEFYLKGKENTLRTESNNEENNTLPVEGYSFSATNDKQHENESIEEENSITGQVIYTTKEKRSLPLLASIILLSSIGLLFKEHIYDKRKALIIKNHSKKILWQTKRNSQKKTSKKKSTKDTYTQT